MKKKQLIEGKVKEYIWDENMDFDMFCKMNDLDKFYDPNYKLFLRFEQEHIEFVSDMADQN
jgi:hypothetical protein